MLMHAATRQLIGKRFERLLVISKVADAKRAKKIRWLCLCDCGAHHVTSGESLTRGHTQSCGCLMIDRTVSANTRHGMKGTRVYRIWTGMKNRCLNSTARDFARYGGKGITVCQRWLRFDNFLSDMGVPDAMQSLDRINNLGIYEPGNCRWASWTEQARNRSSNKRVTLGGECLTIAEWSERSCVPSYQISRRLIKGWPAQKAIYQHTH